MDDYCDANQSHGLVTRDVLEVDLLHRAVKEIFEGNAGGPGDAPSIKIISYSVGDPVRQFDHMLSPVAKLIDWLSWQYNVLFILSAGNHVDEIEIDCSQSEFKALSPKERQGLVLDALIENSRNRRLRLQKLTLDIGLADVITPKAKNTTLISIISGSRSIDWTIYPAETIAAEKLHATVSHGSQNSRYKDIYDLTVILPQCKKPTLKNAILRTFGHRETEVPPRSFLDFWKTLDKQILQRAAGATLPITGTIPTFQEISAAFEQELRELDKR